MLGVVVGVKTNLGGVGNETWILSNRAGATYLVDGGLDLGDLEDLLEVFNRKITDTNAPAKSLILYGA